MNSNIQRQDEILFNSRFSKVKLEELTTGLKYVQINLLYYSEKELLDIKLHIHTVRGQIKYSNGKFEPLHEYTAYKNVIKRFVKDGLLYHPKIKKVEIKVEKEAKIATPIITHKTLFDE